MNIKLWPDPDISVRKVKIGNITALVLSPGGKTDTSPDAENAAGGRAVESADAGRAQDHALTGCDCDAPRAAGVLWIHGGGYVTGLKEMVYMGRAADLVKKYGIVVVSPGYHLAWREPYPAALNDCYKTLVYMKKHAAELGIRDDQLMVGGESAGGGLAAAVCLLARDMKEVKVAFQMPLYPMLSNTDTESSRDNHGRIWNTRRNHFGWKLYLRGAAGGQVPPYAAPAWETNLTGLPPAYTFVGDGEPFYAETLDYIRRLKEAGVTAHADVYHTNIHAFDMLYPEMEVSRDAIRAFEKQFEHALENYFAPQSNRE